MDDARRAYVAFAMAQRESRECRFRLAPLRRFPIFLGSRPRVNEIAVSALMHWSGCERETGRIRPNSQRSFRLNQVVFLQIRLQDGVLHSREHESDVFRICGTENKCTVFRYANIFSGCSSEKRRSTLYHTIAISYDTCPHKHVPLPLFSVLNTFRF